MKVYTAENDLDDLPVLIAAWEGLDRESFKSLVYDYIRDESIPNPDRSITRLALCEWNIHMFLEGATGSFREANYLDLCWTYPGEWIELKPGQREPNPFGSSSPLVTESDLDAYPLGDPKRIALERELGRG